MTRDRVFPHNKEIFKRLRALVQPKEGEKYVVNRNPRNLEFLRIAQKPTGYELDAPFTKNAHFWHK
jgi:large subunit ribosomal protein L18